MKIEARSVLRALGALSCGVIVAWFLLSWYVTLFLSVEGYSGPYQGFLALGVCLSTIFVLAGIVIGIRHLWIMNPTISFGKDKEPNDPPLPEVHIIEEKGHRR